MFKKKAKKLEVKSETPNERKVEIKVNVRPLVQIEMHESRINGKVQAPKFRVSIADRDVLTLSAREYNELFMEMLRHKDSDEIIHCISEAHMQEHAHAGNPIEEIINHLNKVAEEAING